MQTYPMTKADGSIVRVTCPEYDDEHAEEDLMEALKAIVLSAIWDGNTSKEMLVKASKIDAARAVLQRYGYIKKAS
jgi:protein-arginine kinase